MLIDWFTVVAQVINFLVLVWLLKRFLYKPIVTAMDAREQKIASQLRDAERQKAEAESEAAKLRTAHDEFEQQKQDLLGQAKREAEALRHQLRDEVRQEIEGMRERWQEALKEEQGAFRAEVANGVRREVFSIARNVLADLAGADVEAQIAAVFVRQLEKINGHDPEKLATIFANADVPAVIRSGFVLPAPAREAIERALGRLRPDGVKSGVQYEVAPELVGGIELATDGRKICWSIAHYLSSLEQNAVRLATQKAEVDGDAT
jgi:F-type H+-transporting ATPase subunit b